MIMYLFGIGAGPDNFMHRKDPARLPVTRGKVKSPAARADRSAGLDQKSPHCIFMHMPSNRAAALMTTAALPLGSGPGC